MKTFQSGINTLYIANSKFREDKRDIKSLQNVSEERFINFLVDDAYRRLGIDNREKFIVFCKDLTAKDNISVGILNAHGDYSFRKWCYSDGLFLKSVQRWIDEHEEKHDILLLHVCNHEHAKPNINKSITVIPVDYVSYLLNIAGIENLIVIPGKGAIPFNKKKIEQLPKYNLLSGLQSYLPDR